MPPQQRSNDIPEVDLSDIPDVDISDIPDVGQQEQDPSIFSRGLNWLNTPLFGGAEPTLDEWTGPNAGPETMRRSAWAQATTPLAIAGEVVGGGALGLLGKRLFKGGSTASESISSLGRIADEVPTQGINQAAPVAETINKAPFNRAEVYKKLVAMGEDPKVLGKMKNANMEALLASKNKPVALPNLPTAVASKPGTRFENFQILEGTGRNRNELGRMKTAELQRLVDELNAKQAPPAPPNKPPSGTSPRGTPPPPGGKPPIEILSDESDDLLAGIPPLNTNEPGMFTKLNNASRALQSTWDLSFPFRQGAGYAGRKAWRNSWDKMVKAGLNDDTAQEISDAIRQREYFKPVETPIVRTAKDGTRIPVIDKETGLQKIVMGPSFAERAGLDIVKNEEMMQGASWIKKNIPGVKASDRAFTAFSNQVRADAFESLVEQFKKVGIDVTLPENLDKAKEIAKVVNAGTGRGTLKLMEDGAGGLLSKTFFSPKFMASRINMIQNAFNPKRIAAAAGGDEGAQILMKEAWKQLGSLMTVWSTTAMLSQAVGGTVETDPNSADFGKIRIGNTRLDPGAGAQQYLVLMSRMLSGGQTSSTSGRHYQYGSRFGIPTQRDAMVDFLANRASPLPGFVMRVMNASKNRPVDINDQSIRLAMPFALQTLVEVMQEDPTLLPLMVPAMVGFGTQTYDESGQGQTVWPESIGGEGYKYRGGSPFNPN